MDVAITGSSGLVGSALVERLRGHGHAVRRVVRREAGPGEVRWDPMEGRIDAAGLEGVDAVVHLAGEGIAEHRWTDEHKRRVRESRTRGTTVLAEALAGLEQPPSVLLSCSAVGYYGCRDDEVLTEEAGPGTGFLPELCLAWEAAAEPARAAGIRTAHPRMGIVLSTRGGALAKQLPLFKLGIGGRLGDGSQYWPWIALDDVAGALEHLLTADVAGPVNLTAPNPVTNGEFTRTVGHVLHRPTVLPTPSFGPRLVLGRELAENLLYCSARVVPARLEASGYRFAEPELDGALRRLFEDEAA